jgi:hypothetical protein
LKVTQSSTPTSSASRAMHGSFIIPAYPSSTSAHILLIRSGVTLHVESAGQRPTRQGFSELGSTPLQGEDRERRRAASAAPTRGLAKRPLEDHSWGRGVFCVESMGYDGVWKPFLR